MRQLWVGNRKELPGFAEDISRRHGGQIPRTAMGLLNGQAKECMASGKPWIYFDHAYFNRGWHNSNFRCIRNGIHLTKMLDRPTDRFKKHGVVIEPWRKTGREIVIIPPSDAQTAIYGNTMWLLETESRLCHLTDRPVVCKRSKQSALRDFLRDAWAVVTYASVAGVEAALMGVPVFSTENCPSWPVNAGTLETIETPVYSEAREQWAAGLSYASWNWEEMKSIKWHDYHYETCA